MPLSAALPPQRIQDPSATSGAAVRVKDVWWLDVGGRVRGVLPGRYRPAWRLRLEVRRQPICNGRGAHDACLAALRAVLSWHGTAHSTACCAPAALPMRGPQLLLLTHPPAAAAAAPAPQPHFLLPEGRLVTRLELPAAGRGGGGGGASAAADATDAGEAAAGAAAGAAAAAGEVLETSTAIDPDALYHYRQQAGGAWLQLLGSSFEVPRRCDVWVALTATDSML